MLAFTGRTRGHDRFQSSGHLHALDNKEMELAAPSIFAEKPMPGVSHTYSFLPTIKAVDAMRNAGWQSKAFAEGAILLRYDELKSAPVSGDNLLECRRSEDAGNDLWSTFNRVQENLIRGGLKDVSRRKEDGKGFSRTRKVSSLDENVRLNKAL